LTSGSNSSRRNPCVKPGWGFPPKNGHVGGGKKRKKTGRKVRSTEVSNRRTFPLKKSGHKPRNKEMTKERGKARECFQACLTDSQYKEIMMTQENSTAEKGKSSTRKRSPGGEQAVNGPEKSQTSTKEGS